jgi:hypothetical protein
VLPNEWGQVAAHEPLELRSAAIGPPQSLLGELALEFQDLPPLVGLFFRPGRVCPLVEVDHKVRAAVLLPDLVGPAEFVVRAGSRVLHRGAKTFPKDANEDIAVLDA